MKKSALSLATCALMLIQLGCGGGETAPAPAAPAAPPEAGMSLPADLDAAPADAAAPAGDAAAAPAADAAAAPAGETPAAPAP